MNKITLQEKYTDLEAFGQVHYLIYQIYNIDKKYKFNIIMAYILSNTKDIVRLDKDDGDSQYWSMVKNVPVETFEKLLAQFILQNS